MPEASFNLLYAYEPEPLKKSPIIKVSCGIGDTDGFPAFDVDSDAYASKDDNKWGFLITGGAEFHMPLTVFQVTSGGLADKNGIRLGDIILEINEEDATQLTLTEAHEKLEASGKKIHFLVKSMEDDLEEGYEAGQEKSIVLRVPKPMDPPKACIIEARLKEMQQKLSEIAEIPKILSSTLATVSQTFHKLTYNISKHQEQKRKTSYDEDACDYELDDTLFHNNDKNNNNNDYDYDDVYDNDLNVDVNATDDDNILKIIPEWHVELDAQVLYKQLKKHVISRQDAVNVDLCDVKELTPESDYASELNEQSDENQKDENEADDIVCESNLHYLSNDINNTETDKNNNHTNCTTTTFNWSLKEPLKEINKREVSSIECKSVSNDHRGISHRIVPYDKGELKKIKPFFQLDKLEYSWPWADREKIIYKQSTCHLVPRKPLGIIEKRIQSFSRTHLLENFNKTTTATTKTN